MKNTFIDVETPTGEGLKAEVYRGSQSCTARLLEPHLSFAPFGQSPAVPEALPEDHEGEDEEDTSPLSPGGYAFMQTPLATADDHLLNMRFSVHLDLVDMQRHTEPDSKGGKLSAASPLPAPPNYAAPVVFDQEPTSPPPSAPPGRQAESKNSPSTTTSGGRTRLSSSTVGLNDFGGSDYEETNVYQKVALAHGCGAGSQLHGVIGADGQPACQPCAWFYKESGCHNGQGCRYCHLCPQGELKNRKKQKIQRLRAQDAAAADAAAMEGLSPSSLPGVPA